MNEEKKEDAVNTPPPAAEETSVDDAETRFSQLEAEKAKAIEEAANWKVAALKAKAKEEDFEDTEDERMERTARKVLAESHLADIAREQDAIIKRALKENKELKRAQLNKTTTTPAAATSPHTEGTPVTDTLVTPDQLKAFKSRGWTDKDIERYKRNLQKYGGR